MPDMCPWEFWCLYLLIAGLVSIVMGQYILAKPDVMSLWRRRFYYYDLLFHKRSLKLGGFDVCLH